MTYQLLLTTLGQQKLASAASAGGQPVRITEFAVGQGVNVDFSKRLDQQLLVSKRYQGDVESVASTAVTGQYEITCIVPQDQGGWAIREIGLIDSAGDLIWVGQVPEVQKPVASSTAAVDYRIKAVISIDNPNVNLVIDANVVTATQSWALNTFVPLSHLSDTNPHNQYVLKTLYNQHVTKNNNEHSAITDWQSEHLLVTNDPHLQYEKKADADVWRTRHLDASKNPHPQYALASNLDLLIQRVIALEESAGSGVLVGRLDVTYSGVVKSKNDFTGNETVTLNEAIGFVFGYPTSFSLRPPVGNSPNSYSKPITITLPTEYSVTQHRLSVVTDSGTYSVSTDNKTIVFSVPVASVRDGEGVVTDSMSANFRISIYNN